MSAFKSLMSLASYCTRPLSIIQRTGLNILPAATTTISVRSYGVDYDPNPEYKARSPYKRPEQHRHGYKGKIFTGGLLPRHDGEDVKALPFKEYKPKDGWRERTAFFGQNDYIDILGDGDLEPRHFTRGPKWLRGGFKGDEYMTLIRRLKYERLELQEYQPTKYHQIKKRVDWLYRKLNHRRHRGWYSGEY